MHEIRAAISPAVTALNKRPPYRRPCTAKRIFKKVTRAAKAPTFNKCFETTKDLRNRQNSLSKSMLKATGSLLQGDALIIKSSIANASSKTPEEPPSIIVEKTKEPEKADASSDCSILIPTTKIRIKFRKAPADKETKQQSNPKESPKEKTKNALKPRNKETRLRNEHLKNKRKIASNSGPTKRNEGRSDKLDLDRDDFLDDKTPTYKISFSSINGITEVSALKESMESEKQTKILAEDLKADLIMADEEKDDDNSERNKFVNAWVSKNACEEKGKSKCAFGMMLFNRFYHESYKFI